LDRLIQSPRLADSQSVDRSHRQSLFRSAYLALALAIALVIALATAAIASATTPFPVEESFRGTTFGSNWRHGGSAELTGAKEAQGWLRLTSAETGEFGYAYDNEAFPSTDGALVEFEYADWGGSGADGLTFFLFNGSTSEAEFHAGQPGGSLGYASCSGKGNGLTNAYVGVGFDEYGNFTNLGATCGLDGTEFLPDHVSVRGSAAENYKLLTTAQTTESMRAERSQARHVTIAVTPTGELSVYIRYPDGTYQKVTEGFQLPAAPEKLKFGYVASTGALTDNHEIRNALVIKPTQLTPSVAQTAGAHERGKPLTWTAVVRNEGPNPTQRERVRATIGEQTLSSVSWTCEASAGAECATASGSGLPSPEAGPMPEGSSLTYKITGTPTATTDYAQMTIESEPRGDTGELDPEEERATATTNLTPLFQKTPSFTLAGGGDASATAVSALGGEVSYSYAWQRCEVSGASCTDIAGAESTAYQTTGADLGHTLRFTETATNSAGSATVNSAIYKTLPTAVITSAPARYVASREAKLAFTASTKEATLECSLDGEAWSPCTSPISYSGLADGAHTFSVRAVYGGLSEPDPPSVQWTIEATPPAAPTVASAPPSPTAQSSATFKFSGLTEADTFECRLDSGKWKLCGATTKFTGLAKGEHQLEARQVNKAGVDSSVTTYTWTVGITPSPSPAQTAAAPAPASTASTPSSATAEHPHKKAKKHRRRTKRRPKNKTHLGASKTPSRARKHRPADKVKSSPPAATHAPKNKTLPTPVSPSDTKQPSRHNGSPSNSSADQPAAKTTPKSKTSPVATSPTATAKSPSPAPKSEPKVTASPAAETGEPKATTPSSAATPQSEAKSLGAVSAPTSGQEAARPVAKHPAPVKTATPEATSAPAGGTAAPAAGRKRAAKAPAPAAPGTRGKGTSSATAPAGAGKTPVPDGAQTPEGGLLGGTGGGAGNPLIRPFGPRSVALAHAALQLVEHLAASLARARSVICVGYTDSLGARSYNLALGLERAQAVCEKLRALGVRGSLKWVSRGEEEPSASNATAKGRALNRRVELRVSY